MSSRGAAEIIVAALLVAGCGAGGGQDTAASTGTVAVDGAELRYGYGSTAVTGGDLEDVSAVFGTSSDRGNLIGGASHSSRGMVYTRDQIGGQALGNSTYGNNYLNWQVTEIEDPENPGQMIPAAGVRPVPGFDCNNSANTGFWTQPSGTPGL